MITNTIVSVFLQFCRLFSVIIILSLPGCNGLNGLFSDSESDKILFEYPIVNTNNNINNQTSETENYPPVLGIIENKTVNCGESLQFTISATDRDGDNLSFSASNLPSGAVFDPATGIFSWTPGNSQSGNYKNILFTVTDNGAPQGSDSESIVITVGSANRPPVLDTIGNKEIDTGVPFQFSISAADPDGNKLAYSAANLPTGAFFNPDNQELSWTPESAGAFKNILFIVTDNGSPAESDFETITITAGSVNHPPILESIGNRAVGEGELLQFAISAADIDGDDLVSSVSNMPTGATFNAATNVFRWTPDSSQTGNYKNVIFTVTDNGLPPESDSETITITVGNVNRPPIIDPIGARYVDENELLQFTIFAADPDGDAMTFSASSLPTGANFDPVTREFTWIPGYFQSGNYTDVLFTVTDNGSPSESDSVAINITAGNVNRPPVLDPIGAKTINEGEPLQFTISASDPDGDDLTYSAGNIPAGASFDPDTRTFTWTPAFNQSGIHTDVLFTVTDNSAPLESDSEAITITAGEVNRPPVLDPIGNRTITENDLLQFTISANDPDGDNLTYSASNLPSGAGFNPATRVFSWTPDNSQEGNYTNVRFTVTDNGAPNENDFEDINIVVNDRPWWNPSWIYKREITITENASTGDLDNYQVKVNLDSSFDFGKADANGDDIRFTYYDTLTQSETQINYWIENWNSGAQVASLWVNVTSIPDASTAIIYMYYGNASAAPGSSKDSTLSNGAFNDSFNDSSGINISASVNINTAGGDVMIDTAQYSTIYNYDGVAQAQTSPKAYENDVDKFPFDGSSGNRNDHQEATDAEYAAIWASDGSRWQTDDPEFSDEMMLWLDMLIDKPVEDITKIDMTFEGYYDQNGNFRIYTFLAGTSWFENSSWVQLGSSLSIPSGTDGVMTRSITSNFYDYIDGSGNITWIVGDPGVDSKSMYIDYVEMKVYTYCNLFSIEIPESGNTRLAVGELLSFNDTEPANTDIKYQIEYKNGANWNLIPDAYLSGNSVGFDDSSVDISSIVSNYSRIRLKADLSTTDTSISPSIHDWEVTYYYRDYVEPEPTVSIGAEEPL